jgi:anti-anti-sigma regulatory factor
VTRAGVLDARATAAAIARSRADAVAIGYPGLTFIGTVPVKIAVATGSQGLAELEDEIGSVVGDDTTTALCQYDPRGPVPAPTAGSTEPHVVDIAPELAPLVRAISLGGALTAPGATLRLSGELDYEAADTLAVLLDAHFHGRRLRLDVSDLAFVDLLGMRALRGDHTRPLTIVGASPALRRLMGLLGWGDEAEIELISG